MCWLQQLAVRSRAGDHIVSTMCWLQQLAGAFGDHIASTMYWLQQLAREFGDHIVSTMYWLQQLAREESDSRSVSELDELPIAKRPWFRAFKGTKEEHRSRLTILSRRRTGLAANGVVSERVKKRTKQISRRRALVRIFGRILQHIRMPAERKHLASILASKVGTSL